MKDSKADNVVKEERESDLNREYDIYSNITDKFDIYYFRTYNVENRDFACQYNCRRDREQICTCKRAKYTRNKYYISSQIYRSQNKYISSRDIADVGVGSVKVLKKRRGTRVYLPVRVDTGVGSSELIPTPTINKNWGISFYDKKRTFSKCVGGDMIYTDINAIDKKLSPIVQSRYDVTSTEVIDEDIQKFNFDSYSTGEKASKIKNNIIINTKNESNKIQDTIVIFKPHKTTIDTNTNISKTNVVDLLANKTRTTDSEIAHEEKQNLSSDSLVQHVYNLEIPSYEKESKSSFEVEYRKIFATKPISNQQNDEKQIPDLKSASLLRRRFEALRQGLGRKRDSKKNSIVIQNSSQASGPGGSRKKDVAIVSDPPSLEARSFSNRKICSPQVSVTKVRDIVESLTNLKTAAKYDNIANFSSGVIENDYQGVKGMLKLWGKKFYLDEDCKNVAMPNAKFAKDMDNNENSPMLREKLEKSKKEGKIFSFFKKKQKTKDNNLNNPYKSGKGVTAGRCEVGDGLKIKIDIGKEYNLKNSNPAIKSFNNDYNTITRETWLKRFLSSQIDIYNSAHVRWNNKMYTASSSTVFELLDCVYKNNAVVMRSKSDMISTYDSSIFYNHRHKVNFMKQDIKAFMIPKTILDIQKNKQKPLIIHSSKSSEIQKENVEDTFSNQKWLIDKSKAFSQDIEIVLHTNNIVQPNNNRSYEYIIINIPRDYFSDTASESYINQSSDEEVYKIVEYEAPYSSRNLRKKKERNLDTGDHNPTSNDIKVTVSIKVSDNIESKVLETVIKKPSLQRNVVIQGSNVLVPKRCDVIGVGIITQKDIRNIKKPILKIKEYLSDDESYSILIPQIKCELAKNYLQDYYRHWTPFGIDFFYSCLSDTQVRGSSEDNSLNSLNYQGDGSKSCPNIYDDYQATTIVTSCETSSCSQCRGLPVEEHKVTDNRKLNKYLNFMKKPYDSSKNDGKRVLPKDSFEVFKKRKMYADSNRSNWCKQCPHPSEPYSIPSAEDKCAQNTSDLGPKPIKPNCKKSEPKKRVLLQDSAYTDKCIEGILSYKKLKACEICGKGQKLPSHIRVKSKATCEIPQPPCKEVCMETKKPACNKKNSPTCNVPTPPPCPAGTPSPCQDPCPPKSPPCIPKIKCDSPPPCLPISLCPLTSPIKDQESPTCPPKAPSCSSKNSSLSNRTKLGSPKSSCHLCQCSPARLSSPSSSCLKKSSMIMTSKKPCPSKTPNTNTLSSTPPKKSCATTKTSCTTLATKSPCACSRDSCPNSLQPKSQTCLPKKTSLKLCLPEKSSCNRNLKSQFDRKHTAVSPKESGISLTMVPEQCHKSNSITDTVKRFVHKVASNLSGRENQCEDPYLNRLPPPPACDVSPPMINTSNNTPKFTGVHLRKMPYIKKGDCCEITNDLDLIRLNSKEEIHIKLRQTSPSTDEIRENCNIKVQDEDGRTLYERRDYKKDRPYIVRDIYRDSHVNRVSTPNLANDIVSEKKSSETKVKTNNNNLCSVVEINLILKIKQNDKITEINKNNCGDNSKDRNYVNNQVDAPKDVFLVPNQNRPKPKDDVKDLNINVKIKNYTQTDVPVLNENVRTQLDNEEFSKKISNKLKAVSTGYSEILLKQQAYSMHNTFDLNNLQDKTISEQTFGHNSVHLMNLENTVKPDLLVISLKNSDVPSPNKESSKKPSKESDSYKKHTSKTDVSKTDKEITKSDETATNECNNSKALPLKDQKGPILKHRRKEEKKKLLINIFETESKLKGRRRKEELKKILCDILTSDSSDETNISNQLADEVTYASFKPHYFRDTDSLTNYYQIESTASEKDTKTSDTEDQIYPTEEDNDTSITSNSKVNEKFGCLCSQFAAKLNINKNVETSCCCGVKERKNEETYCDLIKEYQKDYNTNYVDVETQNSNFGKLKSIIMTNTSTTVKIEEIVNDQRHNSKHRYRHKRYLKSDLDNRVYTSDEEMIESNRLNNKENNRIVRPEDILQLNETKRAVLEIYAQKTISGREPRVIARLPKFVANRESEMCNYEQVFAGFKSIKRW